VEDKIQIEQQGSEKKRFILAAGKIQREMNISHRR
jgi:hypothetical protein